ncbi:hypothetical protein [Lacticaseibacillus suihuaensis]
MKLSSLKRIKATAICCTLITTISLSGEVVRATTSTKSLYQVGVDSGIINPTTYSEHAFQCAYEEGFQIYTQQLAGGMPFTSYNEWFQAVGFGAMPDGSNVDPNIPAIKPRSAAANIERFVHDVKKGDILIVNSGGFGHAAIATTHNYVLEMHGGGNLLNWTVTGISDNNR